MKIFFKILAVIGAVSVMASMVKGHIFPFGIVVAIVFGYLGWRETKSDIDQAKEKAMSHMIDYTLYNSQDDRQSNREKSLSALMTSNGTKTLEETRRTVIKRMGVDKMPESDIKLIIRNLQSKRWEEAANQQIHPDDTPSWWVQDWITWYLAQKKISNYR